MAGGVNTTGTPNTNNYNVGRGKVYFASLDANDKPLAWRDLGNATEFNISIETETLEHTSSRGGLKVVDKEVTISQKASVSVTLDELEFDNLRLFFSGTVHDSLTNPANTNVASSGSELVIAPTTEKGRYYDLIDASGGRLYDITKANLVVVMDPTGANAGPITMVQDTDYTVDEEFGRIFIVSYPVGGTAADALSFYYTTTSSEAAYDEVRGLQSTAVTGALKIITENPADSDEKTEYVLHKVNLKPEGDFSLIGDDWTVMQLTGAAESSSWSAVSSSPTLSIRKPN